jgi:excisionase family DNA binding protein
MSAKNKNRNTAVYTIQQVADLLGCSKQHVINAIDQGELEAVNIGLGVARVWRIEFSAFDRYRARKSSLRPGGGK